MKKLGEILVEFFDLDNENLQIALEKQKSTDRRLIGSILLEMGFVSENQLYRALAMQHEIPWKEDVSFLSPVSELSCILPEYIAKDCGVVPIEIAEDQKEGRIVTLAIYNTIDLYTIDNIRFMTESKIRIVMAPKDKVLSAIDKLYGGVEEKSQSESIPNFLQILINKAIEQDCVKLSIVYAKENTDEFLETINVSVFNKFKLYRSESQAVQAGTYRCCIDDLKKNFGLLSISGVVSLLPRANTSKAGRASLIVIHSNGNAIDVYIDYNQNEDIRDSIIRASELLCFISCKAIWKKVKSKNDLLENLGGLEDMIEGWLKNNGIKKYDTKN